MSTSEWVNFGMLCVLLATILYTRARHRQEDDREVEDSLTQHLIECARKNGEVEVTLKRLELDLERVEHKVDNLGAQFQRAAFGSGGSFLLKEDKDALDR